MIEDLQVLANQRDVPHQSLVKVFLAERLMLERPGWPSVDLKGVVLPHGRVRRDSQNSVSGRFPRGRRSAQKSRWTRHLSTRCAGSDRMPQHLCASIRSQPPAFFTVLRAKGARILFPMSGNAAECCGADLQVCAGPPGPALRATEQAGVDARRRPRGPPHD
jgi:hypothetical protein